MNYYTTAETPLGELIIAEEGGHITRLFLSQEDWMDWKESVQNTEHMETPYLAEAKKQLHEYFAGERKTFSLPLSQKGTPFQQKVWEALAMIPYGESRSYADVAAAVGSPKAVRAVGQANKRNDLPIFVPCHRVIGKNSALTGYAGSKTDIKAFLLNIEQISYKEK
ncbi:methylated-DNA--[protein]-cysteine S-methyltransferase [Bacillus inaquosorum]|uniref:methylated-DNA--[protein]-cysteine S-methyltransferase n=1 Tax=Bacillus inaquosorum TaxID=483913 RepID=UPI002283032E|nr:methylated-DNA--[protein]-cysteine S-methyltransferase [Bacillus inaquosorum]MCY7767567.1 methylated-DNA--[protein]-cysteine S-methyltransferase [Bacillus inaquosorum]MCY9099020.1 methylated-DNA--[protein]-cysteine S-methyltransferase [Bacillus inaquosorum]MCY9309770.1 methylated-DNA--[protein]-cysteine S-methyltransferase [Bacillus inaquosorum]